MSKIFVALGGIEAEQAAKRTTPLPGDFVHEQSGVMIEIDESQHFTTARLTTLELYPSDAPLGFSLGSYRDLCEQWRARSERYRASKDARGFGPGGRVRQRAYHDALRDLAAPVMGHPPVLRVAAPDRDGDAAYLRVRDQLVSLLEESAEGGHRAD